jgi:predicted MPP superfamily phosphohydrolase
VPPAPIEPYEIRHPAVPESLEGLTILHISDLHARRKRTMSFGLRRAAAALAATPVDLVVLTGDYMDRPGDEPGAMAALGILSESWRPRYGAYGIFGNHDSWMFRKQAAALGGIKWLGNGETSAIPIPGAPLTLLGFNEPEDVLGTVLEVESAKAPKRQSAKAELSPGSSSGDLELGRSGDFSIALAHYPSEIYTAADLGIPIVLAGHTHGGQWRLSASMAPHTSTDLPPHLASGMLRFRGALCAISRGLGYAAVEFRFNCPPQIPLYTLKRGALPGGTSGRPDGISCAIPW